MLLVGDAHYHREPLWSLDRLAVQCEGAPRETVAEIVSALEEKGLIVASNHQPPVYLPANDIGAIQLRDIVMAMREEGDKSKQSDTCLLYTSRTVAFLLGRGVIGNRLIVDGRIMDPRPGRLFLRQPEAEGFQPPFQQPVRLFLLGRNQANHVLVQPRRHGFLFDVGHEAIPVSYTHLDPRPIRR